MADAEDGLDVALCAADTAEVRQAFQDALPAWFDGARRPMPWREPGPDGTFGKTDVPKQSPAIRRAFKGPLVLNSDYDVAKAEADLASGLADAISFGRPFIGNPDLVERIRTGAAWAADNPQSWYSPGPEGYIDYPALVAA